MKLEITEEELNTIFKDKILKHLEEEFSDSLLEYWIRNEVVKLVSQQVVDKFIKDNYSEKDLKGLLKGAFENHVREKFE